MKFLFAPDSFKGTLTSEQIIETLTQQAKRHFPGVETIGVPIADGGEGTLLAIAHTVGGTLQECMVQNPAHRTIPAKYLILGQNRALIEMAQASGITCVTEEERHILELSSYGTGELMKHAILNGCTDLTVAIGGTATNDGGMGLLAALGAKFYDSKEQELHPVAKNLLAIENIDTSEMDTLLTGVQVTVMCDVNNPLTGPMGATYVFGRQKGASEEELEILEAGMEQYATYIDKQLQIQVNTIAGAGAAGGVGAALCVFLHAKMQSGIHTVLELVNFQNLLEGVDLVVTGEGRIDYQSACGKVLDGISHYAKQKDIPVLAIAGGMGERAYEIYDKGIDGIMVTPNAPMSLETAMADAKALLEDSADRMFRMLAVGQKLS